MPFALLAPTGDLSVADALAQHGVAYRDTDLHPVDIGMVLSYALTLEELREVPPVTTVTCIEVADISVLSDLDDSIRVLATVDFLPTFEEMKASWDSRNAGFLDLPYM